MTFLKSKGLALLAAGVSSVAISGAASAQEGDVASLEEIIVTAQKREQSLQDVPISVATVDGEALRDLAMGGEDIRMISSRVPGLYAESSNGRAAPRFYLRGLGNADFDLNASQPVSIIMDDVVMERVTLKSFPLFDVERVEVLRGPQGTLFGRNTPAGIIKFDTVKPGDEAEGYMSASWGSYGTRSLRAASTLPLDDNWSVRFAGMYAARNDWIDNGYTGEDNAMGSYKDLAGRIFVRYSTDNFEALLNLHARDLNGTASIFRANILTTGSNKLNENYDRDTVWFNQAENNPQKVNQHGASLKMTYDFDGATLTSITAFETADGSSWGDIDGGNENGPGFIPFNTMTRDSVTDLDQFTQELRLASNTDSALQWQAGLYYFDDQLDVLTEPFFVPGTTVTQTNEAYAVFGQVEYAIDDATTITAGARWTDDKRTLDSTFGLGWSFQEMVEDDRVSWDIAVNRNVSDDTSVYARIADGFRAPNIMGRDIAFFGSPSAAKSETIRSYEVGFKSLLNEKSLRLNGAAYYWRMTDQQLTIIGGAGNSVIIENADHTTGMGFEVDLEWLVSENFTLTGGFAWNDTHIDDAGLGVAPCGSGQCTPTDPVKPTRPSQVLINNNSLPQAPDMVFQFNATYTYPVSDDAEIVLSTDWFIEGKKHFLLYDAVEFETSGDFEGGFKAAYVWNDGQYEASIFGRNITNEHNIKGIIDFNNNTGFVNEPRIIGVGFQANF